MNPNSIFIAPSILSADFTRLGEEVRALEEAGADWIHIDVMDGRFVPNITMGPLIVEAVRKITKLPLDVHLMIVEPERYLEAFAKAGADRILVQVESTVHLHRTLTQIRNLGKKAGAVLNPSTSEESIRYVLKSLDQILVMSVNPGFSNQSFLPEVLPKVTRIRAQIDEAKLPIVLEMDGGLNETTLLEAVNAGARAIVAGDAIFAKKNYANTIATLRKKAENELHKSNL